MVVKHSGQAQILLLTNDKSFRIAHCNKSDNYNRSILLTIRLMKDFSQLGKLLLLFLDFKSASKDVFKDWLLIMFPFISIFSPVSMN